MLPWIDIETTGLERDALVLEVAAAITNDELEVVAQKSWVIHYDMGVVEMRLNDWTRTQHRKSGLLDEVRDSKLLTPTAQEEILTWLEPHLGGVKLPMCGSSVHFDRERLDYAMPALVKVFSYRNVDVSGIKELAKRWYPDLKTPEKKEAHRAMDDILESIDLCRFFREKVFR